VGNKENSSKEKRENPTIVKMNPIDFGLDKKKKDKRTQDLLL